MNTYSFQFQKSKQREVATLFLQATIGASGAVTLASAQSIGITSITKEATAGQYTILLQDKYARLLNLSVSQLLGSATAIDAPSWQMLSEDVDGVKTIVVQFYAADAATEANPGDGTVLR